MATTLAPVSSSAPTASALAQTVDRLREAIPYLNVRNGTPEDEGWVTVDELTERASPPLTEIFERIGAAAETNRRDVRASFFFGGYSWLLAAVAVGAYLLDRRVPSLAPDAVRVRCDEDGYPSEIALISDRLSVLPGDSADGAPGVTVVADDAALRDIVRGELEMHLSPLVAAVRARAPIGTRALWLMVGDNCAWPIAHLAGAADLVAAEAWVTSFTRETDAPWRGRTGLILAEHEGRRQAFVARASCCLNYKLPASEHCETCPLILAAERQRRVNAALAEES